MAACVEAVPEQRCRCMRVGRRGPRGVFVRFRGRVAMVVSF